jgi:hypothetical protein
MGSWREGVSKEAQNDLDSLFEQGLKDAAGFLKKYKEFYPLGLVVKNDGEIRRAATYDGNEYPASGDVIADLKKAFISTKNETRAAAIIYDARINEGEDAVCLSLEHRQGVAIKITVPYAFKGLFKKSLKLKTESASVSYGERVIWAKK